MSNTIQSVSPRPYAPDIQTSSTKPSFPHEDLKLLETLHTDYSALAAHGISECSGALPEDLDIVANVGVACLQTCVVTDKEAIGTSDVGNCVAVCARGLDTQGRTVLGLCHANGMAPPQLVYARLNREMAACGARGVQFFLVGGIISRDPALSGLDVAIKLLKAGGEQVAAARIGPSESGPDDGPSDRQDLLPTTGRPQTVGVVLSANHIYFRGEDGTTEPLCPSKIERGHYL